MTIMNIDGISGTKILDIVEVEGYKYQFDGTGCGACNNGVSSGGNAKCKTEPGFYCRRHVAGFSLINSCDEGFNYHQVPAVKIVKCCATCANIKVDQVFNICHECKAHQRANTIIYLQGICPKWERAGRDED